MAERGSCTVKHLDEFERSGRWALVRRGLDCTSLGLNVVDMEPGYQAPEHDESERDQEEVFLVLRGTVTLSVDGEEHELREGSFARVDPAPRRSLVNRSGELARVLILSAPTTSGYQPMSWA